MNFKLMTKIAIVLISSQLIAFNTHAKDPVSCGKRGPSKSTGELDSFRNAKVSAVNGTGLVIFNNNEKRLPRAGHNETYYEFDLGQDGFGGRGSHRAVLLVQTGAKNRVLKSYFTQDHYDTFCTIR